MHVIRYHTRTNQPTCTKSCEACNPIILQIFYSGIEGGQLTEYEACFLDFDFTNGEYAKHIADLNEVITLEDGYFERINEISTATSELDDLKALERSLVELVPVKPERTWQTSYIYELCSKGNEYFHQQDYDKAIEYYRQAAERKWNDDLAFCLSLFYYLKGDYSNAIAFANRYNGSTYELLTFSRGMNAFVLDTSPIDRLNYLLEKRMAS